MILTWVTVLVVVSMMEPPVGTVRPMLSLGKWTSPLKSSKTLTWGGGGEEKRDTLRMGLPEATTASLEACGAILVKMQAGPGEINVISERSE